MFICVLLCFLSNPCNLSLLLQVLPEGIGCLVSLTQLSLGYCHHLRELPESIGKLQYLEVSRARSTCRTLHYTRQRVCRMRKLQCGTVMLDADTVVNRL
jgi:hypothetical protein